MSSLTEDNVWVFDPDATVHQRICAIVAEMPAIGKTQRNEQQKFMYRGHDDVMNALNPLLSKYGVFFAPTVLERITDQRATRNGGIMYEVNLRVQYAFYGPRGDSIVASAWGEGTDSGDKATNKAMTMALKNVLAQTFAVSTAELSHDTDGDPTEETVGRASAGSRSTPQQRAEPAPTPSTKEFDPGKTLIADAPKTPSEIRDLIMALDREIAEWCAEAVISMYGATWNDIPEEASRKEAGIRVANAVARIRNDLYARGDFPPPTDEQYREIFSWAFAGLYVAGPRELAERALADEAMRAAALDHEGDTAEAVAAAAGDAESADEALPVQDSLPESPEPTEAHTGTGEPDL